MLYHHTGRCALQYSTRTFYGLLPPLNVTIGLSSIERLKEQNPNPLGRIEVQVWLVRQS